MYVPSNQIESFDFGGNRLLITVRRRLVDGSKRDGGHSVCDLLLLSGVE